MKTIFTAVYFDEQFIYKRRFIIHLYTEQSGNTFKAEEEMIKMTTNLCVEPVLSAYAMPLLT
jgi:hypothetical protein